MKTLKTLSIETLEETMPAIEEMLENRSTSGYNDESPMYNCVASCMSATYSHFGKTGGIYTTAVIQSEIDAVYANTGSEVGQGVKSQDFIGFMEIMFKGESVSITKDYEIP